MVTSGGWGWPWRWRKGMEGAGCGGRMNVEAIEGGRVMGTLSFWIRPLDGRWCPSLKQKMKVEEETWRRHGEHFC